MGKADENGGCKEHLKGIKDLVDEGILHIPAQYIRPVHDRPCFPEASDEDQMPIIDLAGLLGDGRAHVVQEIGRACKEWGFFQVTGHGVPEVVVERMCAAAESFFQQTPEIKMHFHSQNFWSPVAYSTSFNPSKEAVTEWKDTLYFRRIPGRCDGFEEAPEICKGPLLEYLPEIQNLAAVIYEAVFESLGLCADYLETALPGIPRIIMALSYYPACPDPSLIFGLSGHTDVGSLTILMPGEVPGLQVRRADRWMAVKPLPNAFVINVADQIQILTNGKYESVEHRVVTNSEKPRLSMVCFFGPTEDTRIAPLSKLTDENNPALYKGTYFGDYLKNVYSKKSLADRVTIDFAKASS